MARLDMAGVLAWGDVRSSVYLVTVSGRSVVRGDRKTYLDPTRLDLRTRVEFSLSFDGSGSLVGLAPTNEQAGNHAVDNVWATTGSQRSLVMDLLRTENDRRGPD